MQTIYCSTRCTIYFQLIIKWMINIIAVCFIDVFVCFLNSRCVFSDFLKSIFLIKKHSVMCLFSGYPQFFINFD